MSLGMCMNPASKFYLMEVYSRMGRECRPDLIGSCSDCKDLDDPSPIDLRKPATELF
jgi:hypothetical protein